MNGPNFIRVMLVDNYDVVRSSLAISLATYANIEIVAEAANGLEAIEQCERTLPDVILMDLMMPEMNGVEATAIIRERWPVVKIIGLTNSINAALKQSALDAGVHEFLLKNISLKQIATTIQQVTSSNTPEVSNEKG